MPQNNEPAARTGENANRSFKPGRIPAPWLIAILAASVALGFALYTNHIWEDYYITFRSSKNLATGNGLVHVPGERLHTFTSPLGVLLPAAASLITLNASDTAALWIFRILCAAALGTAAALLHAFAGRRSYGPVAITLAVGLFMTDAKIVDFSINGMETAWMMLFLAYMVWAAYSRQRNLWKHLGVAWAGLMWTRPDSFVYITALSAGVWLFNDPAATGLRRREWIPVFLKAGLLTTAVYLPWFLFAWSYYGTPVPHTVIAKGLTHDPGGLSDLLSTALGFPFAGLEGRLALDSTFLPAYFEMGGWPEWSATLGRIVALGCALLWLLPPMSAEVRAASFTFFFGQVYLWQFPSHPFPWYIPGTTFFAIIALAGVINQGDRLARLLRSKMGDVSAGRRIRVCLGAAAAMMLAATTGQLIAVARQVAVQQRLVEDGNRKLIGLWLRENSSPDDTVFMEPLGYIGYFSELKTLDFPGLSSPEVVAARRLFANEIPMLISWLEPTWLVFRPEEIRQMEAQHPGLIGRSYREVKTFSVADMVAALNVRGKPYLEFDSTFTVFARENASRFPLEHGVAVSPFPSSRTEIDGMPMTFLHAPGALVVPVPDDARKVRVKYGFRPDAYEGEADTDGADFHVVVSTGARPELIHHRMLDPVHITNDRGLHLIELDLPETAPGASLVLRSGHRFTINRDWTLWSDPEFIQ